MGIFKNKQSNTPVPKRPNLLEVAVAQVQDKYSDYPSNGLTPVKLANIFREADAGDVLRQMELFEEMEEKDPHLFSQLQTRKNAVTGLDFEIIPFDADNDQDKEIAEFVKQEIESLENFEDVAMDLLDAIGKGIAVSEIIWSYDNGHVIIKEIKNRHQKRFFWDYEDNFKVMTKEYPGGIIVPQDKFIVHRYKARSGHPSRAGVLRVVAWMYLFKNYDVKDWVSFCEVFGMPLRLGKYAQGSSEDDKAALMRALVQIGTDAAGMVPDGTEIEFKESNKTSSVDVYERLARYCDEQMSKAILGQTLTSDSGGGSFAQSKTHNEVRHDLTVADCKALASTLRRDLIRPLVFFNFSESRRIPYIRYDCEEADDLKETVDIYSTLITEIGLKVSTAFLYKKFSIPKPEADEEVATPVTAALPVPMKEKPTEVVVNDEDISAVSKEVDPDEKVSGNYGTQKHVDQITVAAIKQSSGLFQKLFAPVLSTFDKLNDLDEAKKLFEDEKFLGQLIGEMDIGDVEELLQKAMLLAELEGRVIEHERD